MKNRHYVPYFVTHFVNENVNKKADFIIEISPLFRNLL